MRTNNIKRIITTTHNFLVRSGLKYNLQARVDPEEIASKQNEKQIEILVHALLGVAIECENKTNYINIIMNLSDECQKHLMLLIENVLNSNGENLSSSSSSNKQMPQTVDNSEEISSL